MTNDDIPIGLSSTVLQVIDNFTARLRTDIGIEGDAIDRIEKLLRKPAVPKPEEIKEVLFDSFLEGE